MQAGRHPGEQHVVTFDHPPRRLHAAALPGDRLSEIPPLPAPAPHGGCGDAWREVRARVLRLRLPGDRSLKPRARACSEAPDSGDVLPDPIGPFIERIKRSEKFGDDVVFTASLPAQDASYATLAAPLPEAFERALGDLGVSTL